MTISKYLMMGAKIGIGLFPKSVRNFVKKSPVLTSFYSRSLQKSGLFYGFPSQKNQQALYTNIIKSQNVKITNIIRDSAIVNPKVDVVIFTTERGAIESTLSSLSAQREYIRYVYVVSNTGECFHTLEFTCHVVSSFSLISKSKNSIPLFLLNQGDIVHNKALAVLSRQILNGAIYVDSDEINGDGERLHARMLPKWNPDYQLSAGYVETAVLILPSLLDIIHAEEYASVSAIVANFCDYNLNVDVRHLALSLVSYNDNHKRKFNNMNEIIQVVKRLGGSARLDKNILINKIQWPIGKEPLVSLIIPTKNSKRLVQNCIESILNKTTYTNYEIILVDNNSDDKESLEYFLQISQHPKITALKYPYPFNYSAINNFAVNQCKGDVIGLVNNDIEVITPSWIDSLLGHALRSDVGCVGAKLLYPDERIQHAGVVMGYGGGAGHAHKYFPRFHPGYMKRLCASNNFSAVTAACLFVRREVFIAVGGLNEKDLKVAFNDVDFCLKVLELGMRNLYCAEAELYHHESVSRGLDNTREKRERFEKELAYLQVTWAKYIESDPAYNANLTLRSENFAMRK